MAASFNPSTGEIEPYEEKSPSREVVVPGVGTVVNLDDPVQVAQALVDVRDYKRRVDEIRPILENILREESQRIGTKTIHLEGLTASIGSDNDLTWDMTVIATLIDAGLPIDRYAELVEETVSYKVNGNVARQIAGSNPAYAEIIEAAKIRVEKVPYVSVKPR